MLEAKRAHFVCHACSVRKKACDKALPTCSFCAKRKLPCRYEVPARSRKGRRTYNPGRNFVALESPSSSEDHQQAGLARIQTPGYRFPSAFDIPTSQSIQGLLNHQVLDVLNCANLTVEEIGARYFQSFHKLYPIISPQLFHHVEAKYRRGGSIPTAECSLQLLAMYLATTLPGPDRSSHHRFLNREQLYINTKLLFTQAQATIQPSLSLLQVAFIIAAWEYACCRSEIAYVSITTCSGLARFIGIGTGILKTSKDKHETAAADFDGIERENTAWAIAMLERAILAEIDKRTLRPLTDFPDSDCRLPSDSPMTALTHFGISSSATLSCLQANDATWFGRQAQAIFLLDQVLCMIRTASDSRVDVISELIELDGKIRNFLVAVMDESRTRKAPFCSAVAFSIRSIILLNRTILDILPSSASIVKNICPAKQFCQAALGTACNMIIDAVLHSDNEPKDTVPICCAYNLREAIKYLSEQQRRDEVKTLYSDLAMLLHADKIYLS